MKNESRINFDKLVSGASDWCENAEKRHAVKTEMDKLIYIADATKRRGQTTWILNAAVAQPNCAIVSKTTQQARYLKKEYERMIKKSAWHKKLYWKIFGRIEPLFMTVDNAFYGTRRPVIFDNSVFS